MAETMWKVLLLSLVAMANSSPTSKIDLLMPGVQPDLNDTYLCFPMRLPDQVNVVGFIPHAKMDTAHHMLLYGCATPGQDEGVWNCGEMQSSENVKTKPTCASGTGIVYAWGMDAPSFHLPEGVGFALGGDNPIKWLVLQVHYKDVRKFLPPLNEEDRSGITLITKQEPSSKLAGVYLMATGGVIPANTTVFMEAACQYKEDITLHPIAYRTHAHQHGVVVSGYRVRDNEWTELGRKSPQKPQMFYKVTTPGVTIRPGDVLTVRCTMVNDENRDVYIGATQKDEMCNFYLMYYVEGPKLPQDQMCISDGPPSFNWAVFDDPFLDLSKIPKSASLAPGASRPLLQSRIMKEAEDRFLNAYKAARREAERQEAERRKLSRQIEQYLSSLSEFSESNDDEEDVEDESRY